MGMVPLVSRGYPWSLMQCLCSSGRTELVASTRCALGSLVDRIWPSPLAHAEIRRETGEVPSQSQEPLPLLPFQPGGWDSASPSAWVCTPTLMGHLQPTCDRLSLYKQTLLKFS